MADKLVKLMDETGYRQLINMLISIKSSQQEEVEKCISVWQPRTMYQKDKVVLVINDDTYSEYVCKATHESGETFDETYWTLVIDGKTTNSKGIEIYDNYSNLPNDLLEDTIAYCKNDYTDNTDINNTVVYNSGLYVYIFSETKWNYINKEQFEIEEVTEDDIDAWF